MSTTLIGNIGEFFTGDLDSPTAPVSSLLIEDGRIAAFAPELPPDRADRRIDARGRTVCPGLIDFHVHVYEWVTNFGLHPDEAGVHSGATTIVDQGSSGAWTVGGFDADIARPAETDVRAFVSANLAVALKGFPEVRLIETELGPSPPQ